MAVTPNTDQAFLREVDEELRRDQLASIWTRYGRWLIVAILALFAVVGGVLYWNYHQEEVAGDQGEQLQKVYDQVAAQNAAAARQPLADLATSDIPAYRAMARFTQATILLQKNDLKGAAAIFAGIAGDSSVAQPLRDLALIRQTSAEFDTLKPEVVVNRLRPFAIQGGPWFGSAGEMVGASYLRMNKRDLAASIFGQIARDQTVPDTIRQRAVQIAGTMGVESALPGEKNAQ